MCNDCSLEINIRKYADYQAITAESKAISRKRWNSNYKIEQLVRKSVEKTKGIC